VLRKETKKHSILKKQTLFYGWHTKFVYFLRKVNRKHIRCFWPDLISIIYRGINFIFMT